MPMSTPPLPPTAAPTAPELFSQLGQMTRQLHDMLQGLGLMPQLVNAAQGLPDARSRLQYIATKTGQAADRVLTLVDEAKAERHALADTLAQLRAAPHAASLEQAEQHLQRIDAALTEIMLAQDFHDLTGQVVRKVVTLATNLEASLVQLLLQTAQISPDCAAPVTAPAPSAELQGPVIAPRSGGDVANSQGEVDDLLASLGF
jgi:chemotaxis protein CheZ